MNKTTLIYFDGGENYKGEFEITPKDRKSWHKQAKDSGQIGYLTGYRYWSDGTEGVLCYFKEQPTLVDIENRRSNGFVRATWYWL